MPTPTKIWPDLEHAQVEPGQIAGEEETGGDLGELRRLELETADLQPVGRAAVHDAEAEHRDQRDDPQPVEHHREVEQHVIVDAHGDHQEHQADRHPAGLAGEVIDRHLGARAVDGREPDGRQQEGGEDQPAVDRGEQPQPRPLLGDWVASVIDPEILCIERLCDRRRHLGAAAAVLGEDGHHQLRVVGRGEGGEPGVVAVFEGEVVLFGALGLRDDLHGAALAGDLDAGKAGRAIARAAGSLTTRTCRRARCAGRPRECHPLGRRQLGVLEQVGDDLVPPLATMDVSSAIWSG